MRLGPSSTTATPHECDIRVKHRVNYSLPTMSHYLSGILRGRSEVPLSAMRDDSLLVGHALAGPIFNPYISWPLPEHSAGVIERLAQMPENVRIGSDRTSVLRNPVYDTRHAAVSCHANPINSFPTGAQTTSSQDGLTRRKRGSSEPTVASILAAVVRIPVSGPAH